MLINDDPETLGDLRALADLAGECLDEALQRSVAERLELERWRRGAAPEDQRAPHGPAGRDAGAGWTLP